MTKIACNLLYETVRKENFDLIISGYIHDEIYTSVPDDPDMIREASKLIYQSMVTAVDMPNRGIDKHPLGWSWPVELPMDADIKVGYNWGEMKKLKEFLK